MGGKAKSAARYPAPTYATIIEPFAGAAGYSLAHAEHEVVLVELYPVVAEVWRYLIRTPAEEIRQLPVVDALDDLPSATPEAARWLIGLNLVNCDVRPRSRLTSGLRRAREAGDSLFRGWTAARRERTARQVERVRHWKIIEGEYSKAPNLEATWFVDPPYQQARKAYAASVDSYLDLASWCCSRQGQVIVCEGHAADWLPFLPLGKVRRTAINNASCQELIWTNLVLPKEDR